MADVILDADYEDHPKFRDLSDGAFRLWHQAMCYCRKNHSDGLIPKKTMLGFRAYRPHRLDELRAVPTGEAGGLLTVLPSFGFQVYHYLEWNPSKDEAAERRHDAKARMRRLREQRRTTRGAPGSSIAVRANTEPCSRERSREPAVVFAGTACEQPCEQSANVRVTAERESTKKLKTLSGLEEGVQGEKPFAPRSQPVRANTTALIEESLAKRAGRLVERYGELFYELRHGARYHPRPHLDWQDACGLCQTWTDDARLEKLARIVLTTDDPFISRTDRSFRIFVLKASWADDRLRVVESGAA